jgi:regulator of protease activity HflC (stomatin/prohibitin superfamily)
VTGMESVTTSPGTSRAPREVTSLAETIACRQRGRALPALLVFLLICSAAIVTVAFVFGTVVSVGSVGVRKIAFGPRQGLLDRALRPGFHWTIPGYSTIYEIPQTVRVLHFDRELRSTPGSYGSLDVPTIDGTTVDVDVSLLYRFYPHSGKDGSLQHGGPSDLINKVGATEVQWTKYLGQVADNEIKRSLGALSTVEFYEPKAREERVAVAQRNLQETLAPLGIQIESVLLRRYTYREEIDQAIFKKNLQELESAYNKVAGDFAEAQRDVNKVEADGNVAIQNLDKQGISEAEKIRSEGDLYRRQKVAEGDLLVAQARAEVDKQRNDVLSKAGSDVYVALQLTKILTTLKGGVVANVDPYDLDSWLKKLIGPDVKARLDQQEGGNEK